jgi:hypothetical protein
MFDVCVVRQSVLFDPADGDVPISVVITKLPMHGRLWQGDKTHLYQSMTFIRDPLGRTTYDPGTYVTGKGVDGLEFRVGKRYRPLARIWHMRTNRHGFVIEDVRGLFDEVHAHLALDCGRLTNSLSSACDAILPVGAPTNITFDVLPNVLNPSAKGLAASTTLVSAMDFSIRSVNSSFRDWMDVVLPNASFSTYQRMFVTSQWTMISSLAVLDEPTTVFSAYSWCDDTMTAECERLRVWFKPGSVVSELGIELQCGSNTTAGFARARSTALGSSLSAMENRWLPLTLQWTADFSVVCLVVPNLSPTCVSLPCRPVTDPGNAAEMITGIHRLIIGSHLAGDNIIEVDGSTSNDTRHYTSNTLGYADDIRLYQIDASDPMALFTIMSLLKTPIGDDFLHRISSSVTLLAAINFDHPEAMMYQPSSLTSVFPQWFVYEKTPEVRVADYRFVCKSGHHDCVRCSISCH